MLNSFISTAAGTEKTSFMA